MSKARLVLYPLAVIYDGITRVKNFLYNKKILNSSSFEFPILIIGNLAIGGTGKTPHTEFIASLLKTSFNTAVLSRGYGRKTKGFILANNNSTSQQIGDEPLQIFNTVKGINVAVCEDRTTGVNHLIKVAKPDVIILDDAFQHRKIKGSFYILLTTYSNMFYDDFILPAGDLRETSGNKNRANIIIITKCPPNLGLLEKKKIIERIKPNTKQKVFFTSIQYQDPKVISGNQTWKNNCKILLVTGIVNPIPIKEYLERIGNEVHLKQFKDHHDYSEADINSIQETIKSMGSSTVMVTTSKDAVKLKPLLKNTNIDAFEIPIQIGFLFNEENDFTQTIIEHVRKV